MGKIRGSLIACYAFLFTFLVTNPALAAVTEVDAENFNTKLVDIVTKYFTPLGGTIILLAVIFGGVKMLMSAYSPEKRKDTMGGLGYVLLGAILVGGAMFFAGVFLGVGKSFN
ncbi:TrbC/VirB2 family protein [Syntrophomonas palmitatica]|uniref:TrbC/VirB2 family protein n=1 Tax=Syntrophomonas palmitatica TaxID=402877 RepID=UPI0006D040AB|nr:TrbC/VirB2 family protein [Syntrophomonas palmitatica]